MKIMYGLLCIIGLTTAPLQAAWIVKTDRMVCTQDFNPWGHSSRCQCPEASVWNQKIGECLKGEKYPILVQGVIRSDVFAIGGETTGIELQTADGTFELVVKLEDQEKLQRANGLYFEVSGEFVLKRGVERPWRPTIIVDSLAWLE
jgi:hypothetical protein